MNPRFPILALALPVGLLLAPTLHSQNDRSRSWMFDLPHAPYPYSDPDLPIVFDRGKLEENAPSSNQVNDRGATLGRVLFYDKRLSRNRRVSCASCHKQERAFADSAARSRGFRGRRTQRNSMALANLAYYKSGRFFWDERAASLEKMVLMPIQDEIEMGMDLATLVARLERDPAYKTLFKGVYGDPRITTDRIAKALAQFLRSMVSFRSRFDEGYAKAGNLSANFDNFSPAENLGKRLFLGIEHGNTRNSCASCHLITNETIQPSMCGPQPRPVQRGLGELAPALFVGSVPHNNGIDRGRRKEDPGVAGHSLRAQDRGRFKVPSLRNIELTGPYMHDGRFSSLTRVIQHYSDRIQPHPNLDKTLQGDQRGGWGQATPTPRPGATTPSRSAPVLAGRFRFTSKEKRALVAFLKTLTDRKFVRDPRFSDPFR